MPGGCAADDRRPLEGEILRRSGNPVEERPLDILRLLVVQPLGYHRDGEDVARAKDDALAPVRVEQAVAIECDEPSDQAAKYRIGHRPDRQKCDAEPSRELMRPEDEPGDDAEAAATAAFELA